METNFPSFSTLILFSILILRPTDLNKTNNFPPSNVSLISPDEWGKDMNYIGAFKQDSRQKWNHIELEEK